MEAKHTATPWVVCQTQTGGLDLPGFRICETNDQAPSGIGRTVAWADLSVNRVRTDRPETFEIGHGSEAEANAAFIVRACNAHDDLVASGELVHEAMVDLLKAYAIVQEHYGLKPEASEIYNTAKEANRRLVASLAKAEAA